MNSLKNLFRNKSKESYFIADIAANHNGSINKAKELIHAAAENGANAAKFQNFKAETIVSDKGFKELGKSLSHQKNWKKSVFKTYQSAELPIEWTEILKYECEKHNIEFFTASYDLKFTKFFRDYTEVMKIGSGEITWLNHLKLISSLYPYVLIATGASTLEEVKLAMSFFSNNNTVIMQCNTNYTASLNESKEQANKRFKCINLNVLEIFKKKFPKSILGLSDHTLGYMTVLTAVGLFDCKVIEKHFTLDNNDNGPDHAFSMNPKSWKEMIFETRELEKLQKSRSNLLNFLIEKFGKENINSCLGDGKKKIEVNEKETVRIQRRGLYAKKNITKGSKIRQEDIIALRPHIKNTFGADQENNILNKIATQNIMKDDSIKLEDVN